MSELDHLAGAFCAEIATKKDLPGTAARLGTWLIGAYIHTAEYPLELSINEIVVGFTRKGRTVVGTGANHCTILSAIGMLESRGLLTRTPGSIRAGGYIAYTYTIEVNQT